MLASFILFVFLFIRCSKQGGFDEKSQLVNDLNPKTVGVCSQSPDSGETVNLFDTDDTLQDSGYFSKKISINQLNRSLGASARSVTQNLQAQGVTIYRIIADPSAECHYFYFLGRPTYGALDDWNSYAKKGKKNSELLGLFTSRFPIGPQKVLINPTIMLRHDTQKWTLLHEQSHYLFAHALASQPNMQTENQLKNSLAAISGRIAGLKNKYIKSPSNKTALELISAHGNLFKTNMALFARGPLEEFAIESMLFERAQENKINFINQDSDVSSVYGWLKENSLEVTTALRNSILKLEDLRDITLAKSPQTTKDKADAIIAQIQDTLDFINAKLENAYAARGAVLDITIFSLSHPLGPEEHEDPHYNTQTVEFQLDIIDNL